MRNPVLVVGRGDRAKSQLCVEALESLLRPDAHFAAGVERCGSCEAFAHRLACETRAAERCGREYAANRRLGVFAAWIDQAQTRWTPTNRDRWYGLGVNTWAGGGRWAVSHGGILHSRGKNAEGESIEASIVSHAFRAADGIAVFIALEWSAEAEMSLNALRKVIGETHKVVKTLP